MLRTIKKLSKFAFFMFFAWKMRRNNVCLRHAPNTGRGFYSKKILETNKLSNSSSTISLFIWETCENILGVLAILLREWSRIDLPSNFLFLQRLKVKSSFECYHIISTFSSKHWNIVWWFNRTLSIYTSLDTATFLLSIY